ncbi:MAG TPA: hypothetical protein VD906_07515 [Caulobacteraceae bacterium]|nr:hypothetical protein [Caulobacteraceae bacterium]
MKYVSVEEAVGLPGLRIAFTRGVPSPWGLAARTIFELKGIDYVAVAQEAGAPNEALRAWTGQTSAPVAVLDGERPRSSWFELLLLAERLRPAPRLIPLDEDERTMMFGLCHEISAEDGLGWNLRLLLMERPGSLSSARMRAKYTVGGSLEDARRRVNAIVGLLARKLTEQAASGSSFFVGDALSAADIYWTAFSNLLSSMPRDICVAPDYYSALGEFGSTHLDQPLPSILIEHRDRILRDHFALPIQF